MGLQFTVGMALINAPPFSESIRAMFTVMNLQIHHPQVTEVIIVDNKAHPNNPLQHLPAKTNGFVKYINMPDPVGTARPRNRVFAEAQNEYVAVMDPHVILYPNSFSYIEKFYEKYGDDCPDVLHGPLMTEARNAVMATHMNDQWRCEMLGTWGRAWEKDGIQFSCIETGVNSNALQYVTLNETGEQQPLSQGIITKLVLPQNIGWAQHERILSQAGCRPPLEPFPIPGHGMGFWACRRDAWLPFHPLCKGFGGEEITTGYRFRQAGRKAWCIPRCRWWHHFDRMHGGTVPYLLSGYDKCRNYVLEFSRLGLDLNPIYEHFVLGKLGANRKVVPEHEWHQIVNGIDWPEKHPQTPNHLYATREEAFQLQLAKNEPPRRHQGDEAVAIKPKADNSKCGEKDDPAAAITATYNSIISQESPINKDLPNLKQMVKNCPLGDVVEITHQNLGTYAILAAAPKSLTTYGYPANEQRVQHIRQMIAPTGTAFTHSESLPSADGIPECDLLFLDIDPHSEQVYHDLLMACVTKVRRLIALHDTVVYGEQYNGGPGLMPAINRFIQESNGTWHIAKHYTTQNGFMVLSRFAADKAMPDAPADEITAAMTAKPPQTMKIPEFGPGTELREIFKMIGVVEKEGCDCAGKMSQMNMWGVAGCRQNMNTIVGWMKDGMERWGWVERMKAMAAAAYTGLAFKVNPLDPWTSIINLAIDRAEEKEKVAA